MDQAGTLYNQQQWEEALAVFTQVAALAVDSELLMNCHTGLTACHSMLGQRQRTIWKRCVYGGEKPNVRSCPPVPLHQRRNRRTGTPSSTNPNEHSVGTGDA